MVVLAVAVDEGADIVSKYAQDNKLTFTFLPDPEGKVNPSYRVFKHPEVFFIDANGVVRQKDIGYLSKAIIVSKFKLTRQFAS